MAYDQTVNRRSGVVVEPWAWVLVGVAIGAVAVLAVTKPKALRAFPEALVGPLVALPVALPVLLLVVAAIAAVALLLAVVLIPSWV
jgi:uncharacterized membrane protein